MHFTMHGAQREESVENYHGERNHQGLNNQLIAPGPEVGRTRGRVKRQKRLSGILSYYYREAA